MFYPNEYKPIIAATLFKRRKKKPADANLKEQKLNQGMNYSLQTSYIKNVFEILQ